MTWTKNKPTTPGYWWHEDVNCPKQIVYVYDAVGGLFVEMWNGQIFSMSLLGGEWSDQPIEEPKEA